MKLPPRPRRPAGTTAAWRAHGGGAHPGAARRRAPPAAGIRASARRPCATP